MHTKINSQTLSVGVILTGGRGTRHALNLHRALGSERGAAVVIGSPYQTSPPCTHDEK